MNRTINLQQLKGLFLVKGLLALLLVAPSVATAAGTGSATVDDIKDTNYSVPAGAYFVSPDGKDTNTGSYASPWSVTKALASAPSEATIVFKGGIYRNVDSNITKKLTLQAAPHEKPLLKGSIEVTGWVSDGNTWRKDGWTYSFPPDHRSIFINSDYPLADHGDMVYVDGVALEQVANKAKVVPGKFYVDYVTNKLYIGNQPTGKTVEATALSEAFSMGKTNPSNTVIRGLGFAHYANIAISVTGSKNITLENNTFVWNGEQGVKFSSAADAIVRGNIFSYNGLKGLGGSADRILVEGNTISYNNTENFAKTWAAAGAKFIQTDGLIFRNNIVENNLAVGMWMDISTTNATVVNNTVRYNGLGIFFELSHKAIIAGNIAHHNTVGIILSDSSNARVYNNTLSMNKTQITVKDTRRQNTNPKEVAAGITWITTNNVLKNNILSNAADSALYAPDCQPSASMIADTDYNIYYDTSGISKFKWSLGKGKCSLTYNSLAAFKSATDFEQYGLSSGNAGSNPLFVDEANGDYRLKAGSPAINRGQILQADIANAVGWRSGASVDMGALQSK